MKKRGLHSIILFPLASVKGGSTVPGEVIDFDAANQMVETNQVLELYIAEAAEAAVTGDPAVKEEATLEVTTAPTTSGDITVAGVTITLDKDVQTTQALTAAKIAEADFSGAGWTATQGEGADAAKVFFVATRRRDLLLAAATPAPRQRPPRSKAAGSSTTRPKLHKITTLCEQPCGRPKSEVFDVANLVEVSWSTSAPPDKCGRYVRVDLVGTVRTTLSATSLGGDTL